MPVGAPGAIGAGVTEADTVDNAELPINVVAITLNVTPDPFVKPVTVADRTFPTVTGLPTEGVTVYPVIVEPPSEAGAVQETDADALLATAVTPVGAPGGPFGITSGEYGEVNCALLLYAART
jgi:hypothetical protein